MNAYPWYALRVRSRAEQVAMAGLRGKGFEPFVPTYRSRRRWSDRVKEIELPLFPGYVFCRLDVARRLPALTAPAVIEIVGIGRKPAPVEEFEMEAVRALVQSGLPVGPWTAARVGDKVRVTFGPLRGVEGVIARRNERDHLVVSISLLQRSVSVEMDPTWVRAAA